MHNLKTFGIASGFVAATLIGGTLISAVAAAPSTTSSPATADALANGADLAGYCATWQQTFASELGVSVDELAPAARAATMAAIDEAVNNGDLPSDVATELKSRIDTADGDSCRLLGGLLAGIGRHAVAADGRHDLFGAAATALKMTNEELFSALRSGKNLKEIATDQKVDYAGVTKAILDAAKADLDALVSSGHLTKEQEDAMLSRLSSALESGDFLSHEGSGFRFGFGLRHP
jgi:hypothetical protein